ncbi:MAG: hypothetical protein N2379_06005 [Verrucomicrobiae bacterium]|nr:hypothetical protein [Verrucomicrobiae bacterium]
MANAHTGTVRSRVSWLGIAAVFAWKLVLLALTAQPVPANDAFFYDGAVVNYLLHGRYVNPSLALALPISGTEVFSAYPPLYQAVLLAWMSVFGTSAMSAMVLHLVLFGLYSATLVAILRRVGVPGWCVNIGAAFLLVITFHDRPDSLAHVLGALATYCIVRWCADDDAGWVAPRYVWLWLATACVTLCFCTSLQVGAVYLCLCWFIALGYALTRRVAFPILPMAVMVLAPLALAGAVAAAYPKLWAGFIEHARITPSLVGVHWPSLNELLKVVRTVPGVAGACIMVALVGMRGKLPSRERLSAAWVLGIAAVATGLVVAAVCTFFWSANMISMAAYLQPIAVSCVLGAPAWQSASPSARNVRTVFWALALIGSIRALGMSTWGVACAADVSYSEALRIVRAELAETHPPGPVVVSSAYLYEAARRPELICVHSDWAGKFVKGTPNQEVSWLFELRPQKLILTQFDYYRRYRPAIEVLAAQRGGAQVRFINAARLRTPDSYPRWQRVVQHVSWAPVVIELTWP